jgi:hypothetical protein
MGIDIALIVAAGDAPLELGLLQMTARPIDAVLVNRRAKLTPYRRPKLTPFATLRSGPEPTELITEWRRVRP